MGRLKQVFTRPERGKQTEHLTDASCFGKQTSLAIHAHLDVEVHLVHPVEATGRTPPLRKALCPDLLTQLECRPGLAPRSQQKKMLYPQHAMQVIHLGERMIAHLRFDLLQDSLRLIQLHRKDQRPDDGDPQPRLCSPTASGGTWRTQSRKVRMRLARNSSMEQRSRHCVARAMPPAAMA